MENYLHLSFGNLDIAGIIYYMINVPILIFAMTKIGKNFLIKTLVTVTFMTIFLAVIPIVPVIEDTMASCLVGGLFTGVGVGLTLRAHASLGGIDVLGLLIIRRKKDFSVGKMNLFLNVFLYGMCVLLFNVETVIYSLVFAVVYSVAMDKVHIQNINVEVTIITKADTYIIEQRILEELGRGITKWEALGAYTNEETHVLYIILSKYELIHLKNIIRTYDPNAFIVINESVFVNGNYIKRI